MSSTLKKQAVNGVIWTFAQRFSVQIINFGVQIILARLLLPEMFGLIAMLSVFISIGQTLMDGGMTSSLIRTKNPDQLDFSTVFVANFIVSTAAYLLTFLAAPFIADFYHQPILKDILRVYALTFVIRSLVAVHVAKLTKEMNFKTQMKLQVPSTIIGAIVGVCMAYLGFGVWSLVWLNLIQAIAFTIQNWMFIKWRPSFVFNKRRLKYHLNFGYKMTLSGLLDSVYNDSYRIVIGKVFSPTMTGYFNQAETMRSFPVIQLSAVMDKVTFPLFSNIKDDAQLKNAYKATMKLLFFIVVPVMMMLIVSAKELFLFLFGEKWLPAVPYFQILAFASIVRPLGTYNLNILKVKGRSDLFLKIEVIKKIIGFSAIFATFPFGMLPLVISCSIVAHLSTFVNMIFSGKLINYSFWKQIKDSSAIYIIGVVCMVMSYFLRQLLIGSIATPFLLLLSVSVVFGLLYLVLIFFIEKDVLMLLKNILKK
ncbi:lipopolysaccharide biosynthesis protein [Pedobacter panaciterrae]|uniref:lipopolysaccharide biosynthesis protein n=1 Tax=Pedobacter panaciterrae TaxID=363849 RepID=UPI0025970AFB|nr:lipopolysaccharide biosynthesis protein [uncultured Pedobacter sp.]